MKMESQGEICLWNSLGFQAHIEDLRSKCCILGDEAKNNISGSTSYRHQYEKSVSDNCNLQVVSRIQGLKSTLLPERFIPR
jgi:hypothetical protein